MSTYDAMLNEAIEKVAWRVRRTEWIAGLEPGSRVAGAAGAEAIGTVEGIEVGFSGLIRLAVRYDCDGVLEPPREVAFFAEPTR